MPQILAFFSVQATGSSPCNNPRFTPTAGKTVFVTGGGIGAAITRAFAGQNAKVAFVDIAEEAIRTLVADVYAKTGLAPLFILCDIRDNAALQAAIERVRRALGDIAVLVNNAGNDERHAAEAVTPAYWDERMAVNLRPASLPPGRRCRR